MLAIFLLETNVDFRNPDSSTMQFIYKTIDWLICIILCLLILKFIIHVVYTIIDIIKSFIRAFTQYFTGDYGIVRKDNNRNKPNSRYNRKAKYRVENAPLLPAPIKFDSILKKEKSKQ